MAAPPPERSPQSLLGTLVPLLQIGAIVLWVLELAAVAFTVLCLPLLEAVLKDPGSGPLPAVTVWVLNASRLARSWGGLAALVALAVGSLAGCWKCRNNYLYWGVLTALKVAALLWLALWAAALFLPLRASMMRD